MFRKKLRLLTLLLISTLFSNTIRIPDDRPTIQAGINAAADGDTVLVAPGTYQENLNYRGKQIVVASHYILDNDPTYINTTIIDGSDPVHPDTASCVLFISGETNAAVLQGFTITGGTGTKWLDEHGAGIYTEGGGILITFSSPTIKNNLIIGNSATHAPGGVTSAGGGGIRCGDGSPLIVDNIIQGNTGMYGGGIVMNYASGIIRNNLILNNSVYEETSGSLTFGGGGIWVLGSGTTTIIENNTIVGNTSSGSGSEVGGTAGGILIWTTPAVIRNNIVWDNSQLSGSQVSIVVADVEKTFNNIQGGGIDDSNIDADPLFCNPDSGDYSLAENSPCAETGMNGTNMGAFEVGCGPKLVAKDVTSFVTYAATGTDEIVVTAEITNPDNHALSAQALMRVIGESVVDSFPLFDDGTHSDGAAGDDLWGGIRTVNNEEHIYSAHVQVRDTEANLTYTSYDSTLFTTIGPMAYDSYDTPYSTDPPLPGADVYFTLTLRNNGSVVTATDIGVVANTEDEDSYVALFWDPLLAYGDIPAGETATSISTYWLRISGTCPGGSDIPIHIDISSAGNFFWSDSLSIHVSDPLGVESMNSILPSDYALLQNYPNPFNPTTIITYHLSQDDNVKLAVYNLAGQIVGELAQQMHPAGIHSILFDATDLPSGIYLYRIETNVFSQSRKMIVLR